MIDGRKRIRGEGAPPPMNKHRGHGHPNAVSIVRRIGQNLQAWQALHRYNQADAAYMIGVSAATYNRLLFGYGYVSLDLLCKIADVIGMPAQEIMRPPEAPVDASRRWRTTDLVARIDNIKEIALALQRQEFAPGEEVL